MATESGIRRLALQLTGGTLRNTKELIRLRQPNNPSRHTSTRYADQYCSRRTKSFLPKAVPTDPGASFLSFLSFIVHLASTYLLLSSVKTVDTKKRTEDSPSSSTCTAQDLVIGQPIYDSPHHSSTGPSEQTKKAQYCQNKNPLRMCLRHQTHS